MQDFDLMCLHSLCEWDVALPFQTRGPAACGRTPGPACWRPGWRSAGVQQTGLHSCRVCLWSSLIKALYRWEGMWVKHCTGLWLPGSLAPCLAVSKQLLLSKHAVPPARTELGTKPALCPVWRVGGWASGRGASSRFGRASWVSRSFPLHFKVNFKSRPAAGTLWQRERGTEAPRTRALRVAAPPRPRFLLLPPLPSLTPHPPVAILGDWRDNVPCSSGHMCQEAQPWCL